MTEYSHGAGCGCIITPAILDVILKNSITFNDDKLLVGNATKDDAAVYALDDETAIISTTDFFMPIVDDPFTFGRIAATNAISDIFAMGGKPLMAIAIFGWPLDKLAPEVGKDVIEGGRQACKDVGISLAGGHSIDSPEPIFGLAVTGIVKITELKRNNTAKAGDTLFLTKPLGIGILSTAQKKKMIEPAHARKVEDVMCIPNVIGTALAKLEAVSAMTDVTGFGLGGHLLEMCEGSNLMAEVYYDKLPLLPGVYEYLDKGCSPGGAKRNFESYGAKIAPMNDKQTSIICDPQTSGGLLIAVSDAGLDEFITICKEHNLSPKPIGKLLTKDKNKDFLSVI